MTPASEIRSLIEQCVQGDFSVTELDRRLSVFVRQIGAADEDQEAVQLYGRARMLGSELGYGHRTEENAIGELRQLLADVDATYHSQAGARP
jgi:hypothetical protein